MTLPWTVNQTCAHHFSRTDTVPFMEVTHTTLFFRRPDAVVYGANAKNLPLFVTSTCKPLHCHTVHDSCIPYRQIAPQLHSARLCCTVVQLCAPACDVQCIGVALVRCAPSFGVCQALAATLPIARLHLTATGTLQPAATATAHRPCSQR